MVFDKMNIDKIRRRCEMRLYLDNCCFNRPFDDQTQIRISLETQAKLEVQHMILEGIHTLVWSYMLEYENMQNPFEIRRNSIIKWKEIAEINVSENESVLRMAELLSAKGLKAKDAIHISCAIESECDYFLTTDMGILKKDIDDILVRNPIEFLVETEEL